VADKMVRAGRSWFSMLALALFAAGCSSSQAPAARPSTPSATVPNSSGNPQPSPPADLVPASSSIEDLRMLFAYRRNQPLSVRVHDRRTTSRAVVEEITYPSPVQGRVTAYLVKPRLPAGRRPAILFLPDVGGSKEGFLPEAMAFAQAGAVSLLIDAQQARPPNPEFPACTFTDPAILRQTVIEERRAIDVLSADPQVDARRIGFVGLSFGAHVGSILSGVEPRFKALVIDSSEAHISTSHFFSTTCAGSGPDHTRVMGFYDPVLYVGAAAPAALFLQNGREDPYVDAEGARALQQTASEPKRISWYDAGHQLNNQAERDRFSWLGEWLKLGSP
jgi:dienelactone hydrolase